MAKTDTKAELTKLQSVLSKNNRLRLEFLGQTSALLRQHGVGISDELLSNLTLATKGEAGDDNGPPKPPKGAKALGGPPKPPGLTTPVGGPPKPPPMKPDVGGPPKPPPTKPNVGGPPKPPPAAAAAKQPKAKKPAAKPASKKK
ncbi:hypothetical protein [Chitinimonas sp. BJYL2]|uniref:hypothetical protein n=1 Tax=Chitinimonas sp. BJYL2 TaxID=2976696 RepID=UPI0022B49E9D|nr:hypothetical protein [Chitinimonas sp. BJYL2]